MTNDPRWPRASAWLAAARAAPRLVVVGAPLARGSITPGRCDLAPAAIREALHRYSTCDLDTGLDLLDLSVRDLGDLPIGEAIPEDAFEPVRDAVAAAARKAEAVVILGGDNSVTRPGLHGLGVPPARCGLLTFDAHFDLRDLDAGLTNGNPVRALLADGLPGEHIAQIGLQPFANSAPYATVAQEAGIHFVTSGCVHERGIEVVVAEALAHLDARADRIYVDIDLDVLDRAYAPAAPGSRPGGLWPHQLRRAARMCGVHSKVRAVDLVEIDPSQDIAGVTALAAAACLLEFAAGMLGRRS
ncbi:MAG: arginase family protein [Bryobacteraceae bacterium]